MATATQNGAAPETNGAAPDNPLHSLTEEQIEELGREFDQLHDEVKADLGDRDAKYIHGIIAFHRRLVLISRLELFAARNKPMWAIGTATLGAAKILENMEIGHNVLHGQWDWMNDPVINSSAWDWDTASTAESWKHSHNYVHHTYTNIRGLDHDLGYEIMRIDPEQKWHPVYLLQPLYNLALMAFFEWGVAVHDLDLTAVRAGEKSHKEVAKDLVGISGKMRDQVVKDYVAWPLLSAGMAALVEWGVASRLREADSKRRGKRARAKRRAGLLATKARRRGGDTRLAGALDVGRDTLKSAVWANVTANIMRNIWSHGIIFCGHFPDQTYTFSEEEVKNETRGGRYVRQLIGAANIEGGPMFHVMSGNLGYQVEHHLYPDMPSTRYGEIAPRVREICQRYELPYNSGPLWQQWYMVMRTIARLAFPGGKPRSKPGPYKGDKVKTSGERSDRMAA